MSGLTYKEAGVDIAEGEAVARHAGIVARATPYQERVLRGIGGFAALVRPDIGAMQDPLLVFSTDGIGTKLLLARKLSSMEGLGIDLVAMCSNDILCTGARGIAFLDYYATGALHVSEAAQLLDSIGKGCRQADVPLIGGETAELPGLYARGDFDLAGFMAGVVDRADVLGPDRVQPGDVLIGVQSTGAHSNGYSLINRVIQQKGLDLNRVYQGFDRPLGEVLLTPTAIYNKPVNQVLNGSGVHAIAHITGGGIAGNLIRVLPEDTGARVMTSAIPTNPLWAFLQAQGGIERAEMLKVFNMGVGLILVVDPEAADSMVNRLEHAIKEYEFLHGLNVFTLGEVTGKDHMVEVV